MWRSITIGLLGVWIIASEFIFESGDTKRIILITTGIIIAFLSFWKFASEKLQDLSESKSHENLRKRDDENISKRI